MIILIVIVTDIIIILISSSSSSFSAVSMHKDQLCFFLNKKTNLTDLGKSRLDRTVLTPDLICELTCC